MARLDAVGALAGLIAALDGSVVAAQHAGIPVIARFEPTSTVHIAAGEFVMGSTTEQISRAIALCEREPGATDPLVALACMHTEFRVGGSACGGLDTRNDHWVLSNALLVPEFGAHTVWLAAFDLDRTEVTVGAYARCVSAGACPAALVTLGTPQFGGREQPVVGVSWDGASAYCHWVQGRLPTEAEWERAARGRDDRAYPWGAHWDPRNANHGALRSSRAGLEAGPCADDSDGFALTAPVGSYPEGASPDGVLDMAGNVAEWVADLWDEPEVRGWATSESRYVPDRRAVAPAGASHGSGHAVRGGGYDAPAFALRTTFRSHAAAASRSLSIGFRCAYDVR